MSELRAYHGPVWNEPVIMELGHPRRRGAMFPVVEGRVEAAVGEAVELIRSTPRRRRPPSLPELCPVEPRFDGRSWPVRGRPRPRTWPGISLGRPRRTGRAMLGQRVGCCSDR